MRFTRLASNSLRLAGLGVALLLVGCGSDSDPDPEAKTIVNPAPLGEPHLTLTDWQLFDDAMRPAERVVQFEPIAPLFSDYTVKERFLWVPKGETIAYADDGPLGFPVGSILVKNFAYPVDARDLKLGRRLLETRLLVRETKDQWSAHTYVWNEEQTEAAREVAGDSIDVSWIDDSGDKRTVRYGVPNTTLCQDCHGEGKAMNTLGGKASQLNHDFDFGDGPENQLEHLERLDLLGSLPKQRPSLVDPFSKAPIGERARSYFDSNCGSCHADGAHASSSNLWLDFASTDPDKNPESLYGVCKVPTSAGGATCGLTYDIVPGEPDQSILICRMASEEPKVRMPPVASKIAHAEGVELMRKWIEQLPASTCQTQ